MINIGLTEVSKMYLSGDTVDAVYMGDTKVFPTGGTDYSKEYLTFNITSDGNIIWKAQNTAYTTTISYSKDSGETWVDITSNTGSSAPSISVVNGDVVMFKGNNITYATGANAYNTFNGYTAGFSVEGNIMSLIYGDNFSGQTTFQTSHTVRELFKGCTGLTSAENLILPATTIMDNCYKNMFSGCTSLTTPPSVLPATTLEESCYASMFNRCRSLTTAPQLPATTLEKNCYSAMFSGCTSLTTPPSVLPATTLATNCYGSMFRGCTSLTTAPVLSATTLTTQCYQYMFNGCSSLNYIKCLATDISVTQCTSSWVSNVSSTGTFVKASSMTGWSTGNNGIPSGWTVQNA